LAGRPRLRPADAASFVSLTPSRVEGGRRWGGGGRGVEDELKTPANAEGPGRPALDPGDGRAGWGGGRGQTHAGQAHEGQAHEGQAGQTRDRRTRDRRTRDRQDRM
jgi:hypothetical protein